MVLITFYSLVLQLCNICTLPSFGFLILLALRFTFAGCFLQGFRLGAAFFGFLWSDFDAFAMNVSEGCDAQNTGEVNKTKDLI